MGRRVAKRGARLLVGVALLAASIGGTPALAADPAVVDAGALRATIDADPWQLGFDGPPGQAPLEEFPGTGIGPVGALGFRTQAGWFRATRVAEAHGEGDAYVATVETSDPAGRALQLRVAPAAEGVLAVEASVQGTTVADVVGTGISFVAPPGERHLGFGERSNAVDQRGLEVENYVAEGPYQAIERPFIAGFVPPAGYHPRDDATYFPIPWLLSTRGVGVLVTNDETSTFRLGPTSPTPGRSRSPRRGWSCASSGDRSRLTSCGGSARSSAANRGSRRPSTSGPGGSRRAAPTKRPTSRH